jgi:hypothetical protein
VAPTVSVFALSPVDWANPFIGITTTANKAKTEKTCGGFNGVCHKSLRNFLRQAKPSGFKLLMPFKFI